MNDFALVTEGVSDHAVIKNVLLGYYKEQREPEISLEHPNPQAVNKYGGWTLVMQYLRGKKFRQAFQLNQYLIVQVDTDVAEDGGFDVPRQNQEGPLPVPVFVQNVVERLKRKSDRRIWRLTGTGLFSRSASSSWNAGCCPFGFTMQKASKLPTAQRALVAARSFEMS